MFQNSPLTNELIKKRLLRKEAIDNAFRVYWQYYRTIKYNKNSKFNQELTHEIQRFNTGNVNINYQDYKKHIEKCNCFYNNNCPGFEFACQESYIFDYILNELLLKCNITSNNLFKIIRKLDSLSGNIDVSLLLRNITTNPFNFLNENYQLLTLKKCEKIVNLYNLKPTHIELGKAFIFNYFLREKNTHYIKKENFTKYRSSQYLEYTQKKDWFVYDYLREDIKKFFLKYNINDIAPSEYTIVEKKFKNKNGFLETYYSTQKFIEFEKKMSDKIINMYYSIDYDIPIKTDYDENDIDNFISSIDKPKKPFTSKQKESIKKALCNNFSIIEGLPGAGKSTTINAIVQYYHINNEKVCLMAPTAKAVKSLTDKIKENSDISGTVHKFVYDIIYKFNNYLDYRDNNDDFDYDSLTRKNKLLESCISYYENYEKHPFHHIIVDEAGMLDIYLFEQIVHFAETFGSTLLLVGDCNQLPPIGIGKPYNDIINSTLFNDSYTYLNEIKRNNGPITQMIKDILDNKKPVFNTTDVVFIESNNLDDDYLKIALSPYINLKNFIQTTNIITAQNGYDKNKKSYHGSVNQINTMIQKIKTNKTTLSSEHDPLYETYDTIFKDGDRIVRTKNDYEGDMRANGEVSILSIVKINDILEYHLDNYEKPIKYKTLIENFELFYASTVHKMQGSENERVIVIVSNYHRSMWNGEDGRELIYTALSRPKKELIVIGNKETFDIALKEKEKRYKTMFMVEFSDIELEM